MASDGETAGKGYLHDLLAESTLPFRYRGRVRELLGQPDSGAVMNFSKALPIAGFPYVVPRITGEFEFPDELLGTTARQATDAETRSISVGQSVRDGQVMEAEVAASVPYGKASNQQSRQATKLAKDVTIPGSAAAPGRTTGNREPGSLQTQPVSGPAPTGEHPTLLSNPVCNSAVQRPDTAGESNVRDGEPRPSKAKDAGLINSLMPRSTPESRNALPCASDLVRERQPPSATGRRVTGELAEGTPARTDRVPLPRAEGSRTADPRLPDSNRVQQAASQPPPDWRPLGAAPMTSASSTGRFTAKKMKQQEQEVAPEFRSLPQLRRPDQPPRSGIRSPTGTGQTSSEKASGTTSNAPSTPPSVMVVKESSRRETTSLAFWERRYLSRLSARIRR
jgi:hypothetical protein